MSNTELIAELRDTASKGVSVWGDLQKEAADAIEVLQAEVERLKAFAGGYANENLRLQAQLAAAPSVPEGWKLVPIEPTEAMEVFVHRQAYKNALAAAPQPKEPK